jgi:2-oxoglutarate/2-oxoacid ferredoxin oxidoreductase subunit alpha
VLLFPEDPNECFTMSADALDLADRLQTPVFVMTDLDIGMNQRLTAPFEWDDARRYDRGKVMNEQMLSAGRDFGRYLDVDGDGIPFRTYPGTHPTKGAYFTRGTTRDRYARYSEEGPVYVDNVERLLKKFETAKALVPAAIVRRAAEPTKVGILYFGSTAPSMNEALDHFEQQHMHVDALRVRAFPFGADIEQFIAEHSKVFVVEQNRDAQLRTLLVNELEIDPAKLQPVLHFDGTPITARFIVNAIAEQLSQANVTPLRKAS